MAEDKDDWQPIAQAERFDRTGRSNDYLLACYSGGHPDLICQGFYRRAQTHSCGACGHERQLSEGWVSVRDQHVEMPNLDVRYFRPLPTSPPSFIRRKR